MQDNSFLPPQDLDAEQAVLGAILLDGIEALSKITHILTPEDFYRRPHALIYASFLSLKEKDDPIDVLTVNDALRGIDAIRDAGGLTYLSELARNAGVSFNIAKHAQIVKEKAQYRGILKICSDVMKNVRDEMPIEEIVTDIRGRTADIITGHSDMIQSMRHVVTDTLSAVEHRYKNKHTLSGITSGFSEIDEITNGWQPGTMVILGGRPGMGKSALAHTFALNADVPVGKIEIEMGARQMGMRSIAALSEIEMWRLQKGWLSREHWPFLMRSVADLADKKIYFSFSSFSVTQIEKTALQMVEKYGVKMLIIDYLQLARSDQKKKREQEVAEISRMCKYLAKIHDITVMPLAQLNRDVEKRNNRRPTLADLRESGQIEQDADIVAFIYREDLKATKTEFIFAKGRDIVGGTVHLDFDGTRMQYVQSNGG